VNRRETLKRLGWLAGAVAVSVPRNIYSPAAPVEQVQQGLHMLGYLPPWSVTGFADHSTARALGRFHRHARRAYRLTQDGRVEDVAPGERFSGAADGEISTETALEMRRWGERGWVLPVGRFRFRSLGDPDLPGLRGYRLREDSAQAWRQAWREAAAQGATLAAPYGDTLRPLGLAGNRGASRRSMHLCGRAVDLNQGLAQGPGQRYYLTREEARGRTFFRILCRAGRQDGSQGKRYRRGAVACWRSGAHDELPLPEGWYVDLTELLAQAGFDRIPAQRRWQPSSGAGAEWWHYTHAVDRQATFLDECELVGIGERRLLAAGYSIAEMDRRPG
jgi:hypothetical protein